MNDQGGCGACADRALLKGSPQSDARLATDARFLPRRVVKLGGSLLNDPRLPQQWQAWLAQEPPGPTLVVVGGGVWVDAIREADQRFQLGEEAAHWLAIDALRVTARLAAQVLQLPLCAELPPESEVASADARTFQAVFDVSPWLRTQEKQVPGNPLPATWECTADSIAARVAVAWQALHCVLLKSVRVGDESLSELALQGIVDPLFPQVARDLRVRLVNLRD